jgi:protoporphyrinogen IX oxidase
LAVALIVQIFTKMTFLYLKAIHIVFVVTWFAGLFYMPRLFVYIIEAGQKTEPERSILLKQLKPMATRLWFGITWPSGIITLIIGVSMLINEPDWLDQKFMHLKLTLVFFLYLYHLSIHYILRQLNRDVVKFSSIQMRLWNEVATLFLISIVFLIVLKNALSVVWGIAGLLVVTFLIVMGIRLYKKYRNEK